ncbi:alpha/beta hydrolase [Devosia albogilva]|uniref:Alpha/beta hydrolase n=1 Tax=Devosia albogilva TaxID=429726 RepID=A0ABW5QNX3_9HYPH
MILTRFARSRIFKPDSIPARPAVLAGVQFSVARVRTEDGLLLDGLVSDLRLASRATLLFLHGNGGCAANRAPLIAPLAEQGYLVVVADYRGYGANPGVPEKVGLHLDAAAWLTHALAAAHGPLLVLGHSLGGAVAIELLADRPRGVAGLLTLGSFAALEMVLPAALARLTVDNIDARSAAAKLQLPWLIVHQKNDEVVPVRHSRELFRRASGNPAARFVELTGGTHALEWQLLVPLLEQLRIGSVNGPPKLS